MQANERFYRLHPKDEKVVRTRNAQLERVAGGLPDDEQILVIEAFDYLESSGALRM